MKKIAIVTGGTSGIGLGVAEMLIGKGYFVYTTYSKTTPQYSNINYEAVRVDQSNREEVHKFIEYIRTRCSYLNCIICNSGLSIRKGFREMKDVEWDKMMEVAVNSHYIMIRDLSDILQPESRIIFTGSQMGLTPHATVLAYGVVKAAVHAMARNLVKEFEGTGTTVNAIVPGFVETPWQKNKPEEIKQSIYNKTAIHRFATVEEIVGAYEFCIDNSFVNGSLIEINGGYSFK